jgi:hypothetical protein
LADQLMTELATRTIAVQALPGKKKKLTLASALPVALKSVTVRDAENAKVSAKLAVDLPATGQTTIELNAEQVKALIPANRLIAGSFELHE